MNTPSHTPIDPKLPPISHAGEAPCVKVRPEPDLNQYSHFLVKSLEPAVGDWSFNDLAVMLLQVVTSSPAGGSKEEALAHYQELQASAKRAVTDTEDDVNPDLARGIYFVALSRAWVEHGAWITRLKREEVSEGLAYLQQCEWAKNHQVLSAKLADLAQRLRVG